MCLNISQFTSFRPSECGVPEGAMATKKNKIYQRCKATQSEVNNTLSKGLVFMQGTFLNKCGMTMCHKPINLRHYKLYLI